MILFMLFLVLRPLQLTTWIRIISKRYSICSGRNVKNNHINQVLFQFKIKKILKISMKMFVYIVSYYN